MELPDLYVGWAHFKGDAEHLHLETCNSDSPGAFKIFRESAINAAYEQGRSHQIALDKRYEGA